MDNGTDGDFAQGKSVADFGCCVGTAEKRCAYLKAVGGDDIGLNAVGVAEKSDAGRAVGVVLDRLNYCRYSVAISLKVYDTVFTLVPTAKVSSGEVAFVVAAAGGAFTDCKRFFRCRSSESPPTKPNQAPVA